MNSTGVGRRERFLVTGASGFVGGHIALRLARAGHEVIASYCRNPPPSEVLSSCAASIAFDCVKLSEVERAVEKFKPSILIHAAAMANSSQCERSPEEALLVNKDGTGAVFSCLAARGVIGIYISTDLVFDGATAPPGGFREIDEPKPASVYGITKHEGEKLVLAKGGVVLRTSLVFGNAVGTSRGFLGWLEDGLGPGQKVELFVDEYRSPIFVADLVAGIQLIAGARKTSEIFHVAGAQRMSRVQFGEHFATVFGYPLDRIAKISQSEKPSAVVRPSDAALSISKLGNEFGFSPKSLEENLQIMLREREFKRA